MTPAKFACSLFLMVSCGVVAARAQNLSGFFKGINGAFIVYDFCIASHQLKRGEWVVKEFSLGGCI